MGADDSNTEDLIVRALTGQDHAAKAAIERAAQDDPELQKFYSELSTVVQKMTECRDWRAEPPTPTARERVRQAVLARLQMAPPRFKAVILDVEVARQKITQRMRIGLVCVAVLGACVAGAIVFASGGKPSRLQLSGQPAFEASDGKDQPEAWASFAGELIGVGLTALKQGAPVNAIYLKRGFPINQALAYQVDLDVPDFEDTASSVTLFLADAMNLSPPAFTPEGRPERSISLVLNADSLVLYDASQAFLGSRPLGKAQGFYTLRIEYLGAHLRVLVKGEVFYDGPLNQVLRGPLHIGLRTSGSRKAGLRFNAVRIER